MRGDMLAVNGGRRHVGHEHHHEIAGLGRIGHAHDRQPGGCGLLHASAGLGQADYHIHAAVLQVEGMRVALAAEADHGHCLALEQVEIRVFVVINCCHWGSSVSGVKVSRHLDTLTL
jgi:hypothetical protein